MCVPQILKHTLVNYPADQLCYRNSHRPSAIDHNIVVWSPDAGRITVGLAGVNPLVHQRRVRQLSVKGSMLCLVG